MIADPSDDDDSVPMHESMILYPESGYSTIQYGPSTEDATPFSHVQQASDSQNSKDLISFIEKAKQFDTGPTRRKQHRDSLLASRQLLEFASVVMVVTGGGSGDSTLPSTTEQDGSETQVLDNSQTQIPTQFLVPHGSKLESPLPLIPNCSTNRTADYHYSNSIDAICMFKKKLSLCFFSSSLASAFGATPMSTTRPMENHIKLVNGM